MRDFSLPTPNSWENYQGFCSPSECSNFSLSSPESSLAPNPSAREIYEGLMTPDFSDFSVRSTETKGVVERRVVSSQVQATRLAVEVYEQDGLAMESPLYDLIEQITNGFGRLFGGGQFGVVYPGQMSDGTRVLVKIFTRKPSDSSDFGGQFKLQTQLLMRLRQQKLFCTVMPCYEGSRMELILTFMPEGSPGLFAEGTDAIWKPLSWVQRIQTALDVAQGLQYLHYGCKPPIIRGNINMDNAELDRRLEAKFTDFWLSKLIFEMFSNFLLAFSADSSSKYWDPDASEYVNKEDDICNFGIVLCELITGRPAIARDYSKQDIGKTGWMYPLMPFLDESNTVDPRLQGNYDSASVLEAIDIANACMQCKSLKRLAICEVVTRLKACLRRVTEVRKLLA
ncbi:probable LRR receptor-like serine/threonine-protein kinase At4g20450 isoform X2 [Aristolochia californica]|uniref:probable LRR receptor-like serine/threonine-protein kinase At4g20450 isoform X2 n=1 Tax=Aristolochia californica TaxID=171875 RepID=UPI0035E03940